MQNFFVTTKSYAVEYSIYRIISYETQIYYEMEKNY